MLPRQLSVLRMLQFETFKVAYKEAFRIYKVGMSINQQCRRTCLCLRSCCNPGCGNPLIATGVSMWRRDMNAANNTENT
jgi:hypothetical protein